MAFLTNVREGRLVEDLNKIYSFSIILPSESLSEFSIAGSSLGSNAIRLGLDDWLYSRGSKRIDGSHSPGGNTVTWRNEEIYTFQNHGIR